MSPPRDGNAARVGTRAAQPRHKQATLGNDYRATRPLAQQRSDLLARAETLRDAVAICKRFSTELPEPQATGARECYYELRREVSKVLALAGRSA